MRMRDATLEKNGKGRNGFEEFYWKGVLLVQIWWQVLRVKLAGEIERLDEFKRGEMWLLLVAAGSGYLARCWHKTLQPRPQLTEFPHEDDQAREERLGGMSPARQLLLVAPSPSPSPSPLSRSAPSSAQGKESASNAQGKESASNAQGKESASNIEGKESTSKSSRRHFSPKALSKKLFSDGSKSAKAGKKSEANGATDESSGAIRNSAEKSQESSSGGQSKKSSPWHSFRSKSKEGFSGEISRSKSKESFSSEITRSKSKEGFSGEISRSKSKEVVTEQEVGRSKSVISTESTREISRDLFRSKSKEVTAAEGGKEVKESSSLLKRTGNAFRRSRERLRSSDSGSLSSRSFQVLLGDGGDDSPSPSPSPSVGSSRREDPVLLTPEQPVRSPLGAAVAYTEASPSGNLAKVDADSFSSSVAKSLLSSSSESPRKGDAQNAVNNTSVARNGSPIVCVADEVIRIERENSLSKAETVNAVLSLRAANIERANSLKKAETVSAVLSLRAGNSAQAKAQAQAAESDDEKIENVEQNSSSSEVDIVAGEKGKRRADGVQERKVGEGKVRRALLSVKRTKDSTDSLEPSSPESAEEITTAKRMKDATKSKTDRDKLPNLDGFGPMDLSQVFYGFESSYLESSKDEKSPFKMFKKVGYVSRNRGIRKLRESPKAISALESCLRAQLAPGEDRPRVARSLNFSSLVIQGRYLGESSPDLASPRSVHSSSGLNPNEGGVWGLPLLPSPRGRRLCKRGQSSNYPRKVVSEDGFASQTKLNDVVWRSTTLPVSTKKRRVSQACSPAAVSTDQINRGYELEGLVIPPMEGLLFSFGVGIGVMSLMNGPDSEVEKLSKQLRESEERIELLNNLLREAKDVSTSSNGQLSKEVVGDGSLATNGITEEVSGDKEPLGDLLAPGPTIASTPAIDDRESDMVDVIRKEAPETPQQTEQMAELEAELEAELFALTSGVSGTSGTTPGAAPDYEELDPEGVAGIADRDLGVEGLPASLDWDEDNDDFITEQPTVRIGGGVPPRELRRLLRKFQSSVQERRIAELEADLEETVQRLEIMESELLLLREVKRGGSLPAADLESKTLEPVVEDTTDLSDDDRLMVAQIEQPRQFEGQEIVDENHGVEGSDMSAIAVYQTEKPINESSSRALVAVTMEPEESMEGYGQGDNDDICDEFLSSVFGPSGGGLGTEDSAIYSLPFVSINSMPGSPEQELSIAEEIEILDFPSDLRDGDPQNPAGEDLDQVVGELLLKRDSSSVKNALNAFLLWEAETEDIPSKDDAAEEEVHLSYLRQGAAKHPTPYQTSLFSSASLSSSSSPGKFEQLDNPTFTLEKVSYGDKTVGVTRALSRNLSERSLNLAESLIEDAQSHVAKLDAKNKKPFGRPMSKKDQSSQTRRSGLDAGKGDGARLDKQRSEPPVFGGDKDFQALLDMRRELRYSSSRVQLSLSGTAQDRDSLPVYRPDPSRAGTNSPTGKGSSKGQVYQSPKPKHSRMSYENRLYQNLTSDWLSEVGSPPDS